MVAGDVIKTFRFRKETLTLKTMTGCTKGYVLYYDTDGFNHATQTLVKSDLTKTWKFYVATATVVAPESGQSIADALAEGVIEISKVVGALKKGQRVGVTATAGKVGALVKPDACVSYVEAALQANLDALSYEVGEVLVDAASGDDAVKVILKH